MSGRPPLDATALERALGGSPPGHLSREGRVRLLAEAVQAILAGRAPSPEAGTFLASGIWAWLQEGGDLAREYWKVSAPAGSHRTPAWLLRNASSGGGQDVEEAATVAEIPPEHSE